MATEVTEQDVRIRYVVDTTEAVAEARKVDAAIDQNAKTATKAKSEIVAAQKAQRTSSIALTDGEKALAARIIGTREALKAKAKELGLSVTETKKLEAETKKLAAAEQAAAKAAAEQAAAKTEVTQTTVSPETKRAVEGLEKSADKATNALRETGDVAGDVDTTAKALAGAIGIVSPELEQVVSKAGDASGGLEGFTKAMELAGVSADDLAAAGPAVAVGLAVLGTAAIVVANQTDEARRRLREYQEVIDDTDASTRSLTSSQRALKLATGDVDGFVGDLQIQTAEMRGELEESDKVAGELGATLADTLRPRLLATGKAFAQNEVRIQKLRDSLSSGSLAVREQTEAQLQLNEALSARPKLEADLEAVRAQHDRGRDAINAYAAALDQQAAAEEAGRETAERSASARKSATDDLREQEAALKAATTAANAYVGALASIDDVGSQAARSQLDAYGRLEALAGDRLARIDEQRREAIAQAVKAGADGAKATEMADQHAADARAEVWRAYYADLEDLRKTDAEKAARAAEQATQEQIRQVQQVGGYIQDGLGLLSESYSESYEMAADNVDRLQAQLIAGEDFYTEAQKDALRQRIEAQKDAAEKQWRAAKNAKVAEAAASTALAAINAIAQSPPPSPFGLIGAGIATAAGVAAVQSIESQNPVFDQGGPITAQADHVAVVAQPGEYIASKTGRATLGDETLRRANAGMGPAREVYAVQVYNHQSVVTKWEADGLAMGGPTDQAIRSASRTTGSVYGHRPR